MGQTLYDTLRYLGTAAAPVLLFGAGLLPHARAHALDFGPARAETAQQLVRVEETIRDLGHERLSRRKAAATRLGAMKDAAVPRLLGALDHPDPEIRTRSLRILLQGRRSEYFLSRAFSRCREGSVLLASLLRPPNRPTIQGEVNPLRAVDMAGHYAGTEALGSLLRILVAGSDSRARSASSALFHMPQDEKVAELLISAFRVSGPDVQRRILTALAGVASPKAEALLRQQVTSGEGSLRYIARSLLLRVRSRLSAREVCRLVLERSGAEGARRVREKNLPVGDFSFLAELLSCLSTAKEREAMARTMEFLRAFRFFSEYRAGYRFFTAPSQERWLDLFVEEYARALRHGGRSGEAVREWLLRVFAMHPRHGGAAELLVLALHDRSSRISRAAEVWVADVCGTLSPYIGLVARASEEPRRRELANLLAEEGGVFGSVQLFRLLTESGAAYAGELLLKAGADRARGFLVRGLSNPRAGRTCARLLGRMGAGAGFETLADLLRRGFLEPEVIEGTGRTGDRRAYPLLERLAANPDRSLGPKQVNAALRGLVHLGDPRASGVFRTMLLRGGHEERMLALDGIEGAGGPEFIVVLGAFLRSYRFRENARDKAFKARLEGVLKLLEGRPMEEGND
jgi:HEAT repeat protein